MKLTQSLALKLQQQLRLTPQLQLAMKMLQLNQLELQDLIKEEVEKNPLLEIVETGDEPKEETPAEQVDATTIETPPPPAPPGTEAAAAPQEPEEFQDFYKYLMDAQDNYYTEGSGAYHEPDEESNIEEYVSSRSSLTEHLTLQLRLSGCDTLERKVGEYLIGLIDRNGYLIYELDQITSVLGINLEMLEKVVGILQTFDPPGIAARNLKECLKMQYQAAPDPDPLVLRVIETHLEDLANNKLPQIARRERVDLERIQEVAEEIKHLDPKPGLHYSLDDKTAYVTPDVFVEKVNGEIRVNINDRYLPNIRINSFYQSMLRAEKLAAKKTISFIKERLNAAKFILESIARRKDTIFRVTKRIFEIQSAFLDIGIAGLKPLILKDVADHCSLHESTISRVTNNKYVQTSRGLFQLKFFFSSGTTNADGEEVSSKHVHEMIRDIVSKEDPRRPLSDSKIVEYLRGRGIELARRTVAKYREELNIRSSSKRKAYS
ncbi:MAG: RNA polymerase factor sigma-54 [Candidatus Riflebacteria bacterium]|nr:RNA polymerase factor sigma-54 [Candidatus Riflebacteria bacterium]